MDTWLGEGQDHVGGYGYDIECDPHIVDIVYLCLFINLPTVQPIQ